MVSQVVLVQDKLYRKAADPESVRRVRSKSEGFQTRSGVWRRQGSIWQIGKYCCCDPDENLLWTGSNSYDAQTNRALLAVVMQRICMSALQLLDRPALPYSLLFEVHKYQARWDSTW